MTITHTWKIKTLVQNNDNTGTVNQIFFEIHSTDGEYSYTVDSDVRLNVYDIQNFVPYNNLTEEIVLQWVKDTIQISAEEYEQLNVDWITQARYADQNSIPTLTKIENLPWV